MWKEVWKTLRLEEAYNGNGEISETFDKPHKA